MLRIDGTGLIYANPKPFLRSRQAAFPTVVRLDDGELIASYTVGEAFESADGHTELSRSRDGGESWVALGPQDRPPTPNPVSETGRLSRTASGDLLLLTPRFDRSDPERSIGNADTGGFLDCEAVWYRSHDRGATWTAPRVIPIPLPQAYELASPMVVLSDGRWLAPFSVFPDWHGVRHTPERAVAMVSSDEGETWPELMTILADPEERKVFWEQRIIEIGGGRLLALAWTRDRLNDCDFPDHFCLSQDGVHFDLPRSTGIPGQTCSPLWLGDGRILCVYNHRYGSPGVRARLMRFDPDTEWEVLDEITLWGQSPETGVGERKNMIAQLNHLRFGYPGILKLTPGNFLVSHWCLEDAQLVCRWTRLALDA